MRLEKIRALAAKAQRTGINVYSHGDVQWLIDEVDRLRSAEAQRTGINACGHSDVQWPDFAETLRPEAAWHDDDGPVLWCRDGEPPWCGDPRDSDWPGEGYFAGWMPMPSWPAWPAR